MIGTGLQGEGIGEPFGDAGGVDWETAPLGLLEDQLTLFSTRRVCDCGLVGVAGDL